MHFIDETGFNYHLRRKIARSVKGCRATKTVPNISGRLNTLILAANSSVIILRKVISDKRSNYGAFKNFFALLNILNQNDSMRGS